MFTKIKNFFNNLKREKVHVAPPECIPDIIIAPSGSWMYASPVILVDPEKFIQDRTARMAKTEPPKFTRSQ